MRKFVKEKVRKQRSVLDKVRIDLSSSRKRFVTQKVRMR